MEVTQKYTSDSSKKKWILRLGIKNIPYMPKSGMKTTPKRIHFLESRTGKIKNFDGSVVPNKKYDKGQHQYIIFI